MADLDDLYQEVILDHNKSPRNFRPMAEANRKAEGYNPLCGDHVTVYVRLEDGLIKDISFEGSGCAISKASASLMTAELKGKSEADAHQIFDNVHKMLTGQDDEDVDLEEMGRLAVLSGVREFPVRVKCASLGWHAMRAALKSEAQTVSTE